eukprot:1195627-Prorocentrum_minimum.AAC.5
MLKRSLNTFMNAMTAPDFTMYPFSTRNAADYYNLLSVYLDAAFFPKLSASDFKQEGHRLEFEDPEDTSSKLMYKVNKGVNESNEYIPSVVRVIRVIRVVRVVRVIRVRRGGRHGAQGVVFNEMKGAMSSMDSQFGRALAKHLFPTSTYHHNSGGDPADIPELTHEQVRLCDCVTVRLCIPELTHEQHPGAHPSAACRPRCTTAPATLLLEFHATHYHPSNACIFSYGDLPLATTLERVSEWALHRFDAIDVTKLDVQDEQRLTAPIKVTVTGAPDAVVADPEKQTAVRADKQKS